MWATTVKTDIITLASNIPEYVEHVSSLGAISIALVIRTNKRYKKGPCLQGPNIPSPDTNDTRDWS